LQSGEPLLYLSFGTDGSKARAGKRSSWDSF
jgi:hypothetical protein